MHGALLSRSTRDFAPNRAFFSGGKIDQDDVYDVYSKLHN